MRGDRRRDKNSFTFTWTRNDFEKLFVPYVQAVFPFVGISFLWFLGKFSQFLTQPYKKRLGFRNEVGNREGIRQNQLSRVLVEFMVRAFPFSGFWLVFSLLFSFWLVFWRFS